MRTPGGVQPRGRPKSRWKNSVMSDLEAFDDKRLPRIRDRDVGSRPREAICAEV